jgi:CRP-like cAMP-binding protein
MQLEHHIALARVLTSYCPLTPPELAALLPHFCLRRVARKDFLLKSGTVCDFWGFVHRGLLRVYADTALGTEHTSWFVREGDFVTEYASFYYQRPSQENMVALEDTELLCVDHAQLQALYQQSPTYERLGRLLYEKQLADLKQRILFRVREAPAARYQYLLTQHPALVQRVPLKLLASYLGITDSSLSRIRRQTRLQHSAKMGG